MTPSCASSCITRGSNDTSADLVEFDGLEQGLEVSFAETFVALALDDLEEDRPDDIGGEDLQQNAFGVRAVAVDEDTPPPQLLEVFPVARDARVDAFVIGLGRVLESHFAAAQYIHRPVDVFGGECD